MAATRECETCSNLTESDDWALCQECGEQWAKVLIEEYNETQDFSALTAPERDAET